jgi:hypothetical protein
MDVDAPQQAAPAAAAAAGAAGVDAVDIDQAQQAQPAVAGPVAAGGTKAGTAAPQQQRSMPERLLDSANVAAMLQRRAAWAAKKRSLLAAESAQFK